MLFVLAWCITYEGDSVDGRDGVEPVGAVHRQELITGGGVDVQGIIGTGVEDGHGGVVTQ